MENFKTIYVTNRKFSYDELELVIKNQLPGKYKIVWFNKTNTWEMLIRFNGKEFFDLN